MKKFILILSMISMSSAFAGSWRICVDIQGETSNIALYMIKGQMKLIQFENKQRYKINFDETTKADIVMNYSDIGPATLKLNNYLLTFEYPLNYRMKSKIVYSCK